MCRLAATLALSRASARGSDVVRERQYISTKSSGPTRGGSGRFKPGSRVAGVTLNFFFFPYVCTEPDALVAAAADVPPLDGSTGAYDTETDRGRLNDTRKLRIRILPLFGLPSAARSGFGSDRWSERFLRRRKMSLKLFESDLAGLSDCPSACTISPSVMRSLTFEKRSPTPAVLRRARAVSYTHLTLPTKRIV